MSECLSRAEKRSCSGFVAADAILSIVDEHAAAENKEKAARLPWIQGLLTFDTPFMGIASPMLAYSAFSNFAKVSNAYRLMSMLPASFLGSRGGGQIASNASASSSASSAPGARRRTPLELGAIPAWRTIAAYTGTTGALAAAGVAAYMNREELYQGYTWIQNHLQFVGVIMKRGESRMKLARITALEEFGFANLYTSLGQNAAMTMTGGKYIPERTFCALPPATNPLSEQFKKQLNLVAKDEIDAHTSMFKEDKNPGYHRLLDDAQRLVIEWVQREFSGYRTKDLEQKTSEAMDGSTEDPGPALAEEALMAANIPLPDDEGEEFGGDPATEEANIPLPEDEGENLDVDPSKEETDKTVSSGTDEASKSGNGTSMDPAPAEKEESKS